MTEMYDHNNPAHVGPQVTARPGTKRHLRQVRARQIFFAIQASGATANAKRAQLAYEAAQARTEAAQIALGVVETLYLAVSEPHGRA